MPRYTAQDVLEDCLGKLVCAVYATHLLPEDARFPLTASTFSHPLRESFTSAVINDESLRRLFPDDTPHGGPSGSAYRSTGRGGSVQLWMFADTLISSGWRVARMNSINIPTLQEHVGATILQLATVRKAIRQEGGTRASPCSVYRRLDAVVRIY